MRAALEILEAGPGGTVQDRGRAGYLASGLSRSGAADLLALAEGAALLRQDGGLAALEMAGMGGRFRAHGTLRAALTGAAMRATVDGAPVTWNSSFTLSEGQILGIGPATQGVYGYLHVGGGFDTPQLLGSRAAHLSAGVFGPPSPGDVLAVGTDNGTVTGGLLDVSDRFAGGQVRVLRSFQTDLFSPEDITRFAATRFKRDPRGNRMGVRMAHDGPGFFVKGGLSVLSEVIVPGDIQVTGDGAPYVLLPESQTTGGYPRIGTVLPCDLPRVAQAAVGTAIGFRFVDLDEALAAQRAYGAHLAGLPRRVRPLVRDPGDIPDLLAYQLISGAITGNEE